MTGGVSQVLVLSAYLDIDGIRRFTYLRVFNTPVLDYIYVKVKIKGNIKYVRIEDLQRGDQRCLDKYIGSIEYSDYISLVDICKNKRGLIDTNKQIIKKNTQKKIHKFGIDIYATENENVHITENGRLILSKEAKEDIIYNSSTDDEIRSLSEKYQIFPIKAIKEIRNRLVYQHKQKEG